MEDGVLGELHDRSDLLLHTLCSEGRITAEARRTQRWEQQIAFRIIIFFLSNLAFSANSAPLR